MEILLGIEYRFFVGVANHFQSVGEPEVGKAGRKLREMFYLRDHDPGVPIPGNISFLFE